MQHLLDLMPGAVQAKRMFGGYGIFSDGRMFALVANGTLYLKADKASEAEFEQRGLPRFTYLNLDSSVDRCE